MGDISTDELRKEIVAILKTADLSIVSAKKVREQIEKKLKCSLQSRKKEFDSIVMDFINQQHEGVSQDDEDGDNGDNGDNGEATCSNDSADTNDSVKKQKGNKRPPPTQRKAATKKKRKSANVNESGSESDGDSDSDYEMPKKTPAKKKKSAGGGGGGGASAGGRKSTGFTRSYNLSPELSALMGTEASPRYEVVKKVWAIIKERNLYDPKNKQYAICDDELYKVMQVKRFRTFAMLKHLKPHFLN